jgi:hypothetical protein
MKPPRNGQANFPVEIREPPRCTAKKITSGHFHKERGAIKDTRRLRKAALREPALPTVFVKTV